MKKLSDGAGGVDSGPVNVPVIDASVHIFTQSNKDLRQNFMREPFRSRGFPDYEMDWYGAPGGEYASGHRRAGPASTPGRIRRWWARTCSPTAASTSRCCTR